MTDIDKNRLNPPDLSELMSQIISEGAEGQRLVFVEYDPATRAFYDHVGLPVNENTVKNRLENAKEGVNSCQQYLEKLTNDSEMEDWHRKVFPRKLAEAAELLLKHKFDLVLDTLDWEKRDDNETFLGCLARSYKNGKYLSDWKWLKLQEKEDLYSLFHWLIQRIPQPRGEGGAGQRRSHGWEKVENDKSKISGFSELAGLEYIFGIRKADGMQHARFNVFLETGEYVGQMIAFTDNNDDKGDLLLKAYEAAMLVRRVLPEVRQARYVDAILSGGDDSDLDHVLIRHLPALLPVNKFYVRNIKHDENKKTIGNWKSFFGNDPEIFSYSSVRKGRVKDSFDHFRQKPWDGKAHEVFIDKAINEATSDNWEDGFINWNQKEGIILAFSTLTSGLSEGGLAVIAIIDSDFFPKKLYEITETFENAFTNRNECVRINDDTYQLYYKKEDNSNSAHIDLPSSLITISPCFSTDVNTWQRYLKTQLSTTLAVVLQPRYPLHDRFQVKKEGKTYRQQYGTSIYGNSYLDVGNLRNRGPEIFRKILRIIENTQMKLADTLYQPRGYRAIARVIFDRFFCPLWHVLDVEKGKNPAGLDPFEKSFSPLGNLVRAALNFEDTLRLEGGYREHFIHSYHVFLLGLFLMDKLPELKKHLNKKILTIWFMTSMYHDIAYPVQKIDEISNKYLKQLEPGIAKWSGIGDRLDVSLRISYGALIGSDLFGARLKALTDTFVDNFFDESSNSRKGEYKKLKDWLSDLPGKPSLNNYKAGLKVSFYQYCLKVVLNSGEHGIVSALLFQNAARRSEEWSNQQFRRQCEVASIGILLHHSLDKKGAWEMGDRWKVLGADPKKIDKLCKSFKAEIGEVLGFAQTLFSYDLDSKNEYQFTSSMLILCDVLSQWGRSKSITGETRICLRCINNDISTDNELHIVLCYPDKKDDKLKEINEKYYDRQFKTISSLSTLQLKLFLNCDCKPDKDKSILTAENCDKCTDWSHIDGPKLSSYIEEGWDKIKRDNNSALEKRLKDDEEKEKENLII